MVALLLTGCLGYDIVAADTEIFIAPVNGTDGAFLDTTVPMRLELYGPELDGGITLRPFFGFVQTPVDADVTCMDDVVLDMSTSNDQLGVLLTPDINVFDDMVSGGNWVEGGRSSRSEGEAADVIDLNFPCLDDPIPHEVSLRWTVDRSAPVPYDDVP